jgi:hypothetical protein
VTPGSPTLRRSFITVMRTMLENGSTFASQTDASSASVVTTSPPAAMSACRTPNSLRARPLRAVAGHHAAGRIAPDVALGQHGRPRGTGRPGERVHAGDAFRQAEWLPHGVISADPVWTGSARRLTFSISGAARPHCLASLARPQ